MKKILISAILCLTIVIPVNAWLIEDINEASSEYRNRVIYFLTDFISQIKKDDVRFWPFEVKRVIDWDTYEIDYFWEKEKIRVYLINTPERWEEWYEEATQFAEEMLLYEDVYIKRIDKDRWSFWRLLREVYIDWVNFWELMLDKWYAKLY